MVVVIEGRVAQGGEVKGKGDGNRDGVSLGVGVRIEMSEQCGGSGSDRDIVMAGWGMAMVMAA